MKNNVEYKHKDKKGNSGFLYACFYNCFDIVELLYEKGIDIEEENNKK